MMKTTFLCALLAVAFASFADSHFRISEWEANPLGETERVLSTTPVAGFQTVGNQRDFCLEILSLPSSATASNAYMFVDAYRVLCMETMSRCPFPEDPDLWIWCADMRQIFLSGIQTNFVYRPMRISVWNPNGGTDPALDDYLADDRQKKSQAMAQESFKKGVAFTTSMILERMVNNVSSTAIPNVEAFLTNVSHHASFTSEECASLFQSFHLDYSETLLGRDH